MPRPIVGFNECSTVFAVLFKKFCPKTVSKPNGDTIRIGPIVNFVYVYITKNNKI